MRVILLCDVRGIGRKFEVKDVADGYARNFLIARGKARPATESSQKEIETRSRADAKRRATQEEELERGLSQLNGARLVISEKANESGKLFAALDPKKIIRLARQESGVAIPEKFFETVSFKRTGEYPLSLKSGKTNATFTLIIQKA
jgi:large subunit ribosomal protein L9